jgi:hypothetical protein
MASEEVGGLYDFVRSQVEKAYLKGCKDTRDGMEVKTQATPWDWLECCVTEDGEGYFLLSPVGGRLRITNEQRLHIIKCVKEYMPEMIKSGLSLSKRVGQLEAELAACKEAYEHERGAPFEMDRE